MHRGHEHWVAEVRFSPDGTAILSAGNDGRALLWDATSCEMRSVVQQDDGGPLFSAAFSPDGGVIATGASDGNIRLYDGATLHKRKTHKVRAAPHRVVVPLLATTATAVTRVGQSEPANDAPLKLGNRRCRHFEMIRLGVAQTQSSAFLHSTIL